uniref:Uncharacterized protein n=1 Tax=Sinocyclocheilus rhinocerous TaxID=307959 RepID=A0A673IC39_9TELE
ISKIVKYYYNYNYKITKEKRELAKQYGMVRTEVSGGEIAEEMEKERRMFQLQMCEVRSAQAINGVISSSVYKYMNGMYKEERMCRMCLEEFKCIKHKQDDEKRQLCSLRDQLRPALQPEFKEDSLSRQTVYSMHQLQGNKQYGSEKSGYLYKRSDG